MKKQINYFKDYSFKNLKSIYGGTGTGEGDDDDDIERPKTKPPGQGGY
ncbi:MAG: hypothetical protein GY739_04495 [Mesoflavibacter sp.]|nr:hypothetical protein [Mesoflavibacter sp.]